MKISNENKPVVTSGQLVFLVGVSVFVIGMSVYKYGITIPYLTARASNEEVGRGESSLTYEQALKNAQSKHGAVADDSTLDEVLALDPTKDGRVAGLSTDTSFPSLEEFIPEDKIASIQVKVSTDNSRAAVVKYFEDLDTYQTGYGYIQLLAFIADPASANKDQVEQTVLNLTRRVGILPVPPSLVTYHKYQLLMYTTLGSMEPYLDGDHPEELAEAAKLFFAITDKLETIKQEIITSYGL